ncbi:MAG: dihydroneopterin aldolase [Synergistaceae bacterium]|jgi:dihydroneopterin aldolase|nr:dihydroneopterin aldolase [Synergistaceae bacterium]
MMGKYTVKGMSFHAFHGMLEVERELGQVLVVDVALEFELAGDLLTPTSETIVRDAEIYELTKNVMMGTKFRSLTGLALKIAQDILKQFEYADRASVSICRKQLFIPGSVDNIVAEVSCGRDEIIGCEKKK